MTLARNSGEVAVNRSELTITTSDTRRARSAEVGGNASCNTVAALVDSGLPTTWASEDSPCRNVTTATRARTTNSTQTVIVRRGCAAVTRAHRSVTPVPAAIVTSAVA